MADRKFPNRKPHGNNGDGNGMDRQPPFSMEAETGVLGSLMLMPDACDNVVSIVRADDFHDPAHAKLFGHMLAMHNAGRKIDLTLLRERLVANGDFELVGGAAALAEIFTSVPTAAHAVYYAEIVREKATMRNLITTCTGILSDAYDPMKESGEMLNTAEQKVFAIRESRQQSNLLAISEVLEVAMDRLEARVRGEVLAGTVETGFTDLDRLTGGLHASELVILAARPSMGKTAFAMNITENIVKSGKPALFVSLEMAAIELIERMLCSVARVDSHRLRNGSLAVEDRKRLFKVMDELSTVPLFIDDSPTRNISEIAGTARRIMRREGQLGAIIIDYLQLIQPDDPRDPRQEQVAKMARRLKGLARELKVPVLCLAQLNRQAEETRDHRPRLSHLRESGGIEQDADVVMFVHRKDYYRNSDDDDGDDSTGEALIIVAKQRNGPTDDVELTWLKEYTRFEDRAAERYREFDQYQAVPFDI